MVVTAIVLPNIVDHGGCDDLKAVRVAALGQIAVVSGLFHLKDLWQRDFLWWSDKSVNQLKKNYTIFLSGQKHP